MTNFDMSVQGDQVDLDSLSLVEESADAWPSDSEELSLDRPDEEGPRPFANLVIDASAFFEGHETFHQLCVRAHTTPQIINEIRDPELLARLPSLMAVTGLNEQSPTDRSSAFVRAFAQRTGDLAVLSSPDLSVAALAVSLCHEFNVPVNRVPPAIEDGIASVKVHRWTPKKRKTELVVDEDGFMTKTRVKPKRKRRRQRHRLKGFGGDWITPDNVLSADQDIDVDFEVVEQIPVAVMTGDKALQNLLIAMGIRVIEDREGGLITKLRSHILRCRGCRTLERNMVRKFCGKCGHATLERVPYFLDERGVMHLPDHRTPNLRGTITPVSAPKSGQRGARTVAHEAELLRLNPRVYRQVSADTIDDAPPFMPRQFKESHRDVVATSQSRTANRAKKRMGRRKKGR